jgi:hypothetical protein
MTTTTAQLKREIAIINNALNLDANANYRFSIWGEFNENYLLNLTEAEQEMYWQITYKFALIHSDVKHGNRVGIHGDIEGYRKELTERLNELQKHYGMKIYE